MEIGPTACNLLRIGTGTESDKIAIIPVVRSINISLTYILQPDYPCKGAVCWKIFVNGYNLMLFVGALSILISEPEYIADMHA